MPVLLPLLPWLRLVMTSNSRLTGPAPLARATECAILLPQYFVRLSEPSTSRPPARAHRRCSTGARTWRANAALLSRLHRRVARIEEGSQRAHDQFVKVPRSRRTTFARRLTIVLLQSAPRMQRRLCSTASRKRSAAVPRLRRDECGVRSSPSSHARQSLIVHRLLYHRSLLERSECLRYREENLGRARALPRGEAPSVRCADPGLRTRLFASRADALSLLAYTSARRYQPLNRRPFCVRPSSKAD